MMKFKNPLAVTENDTLGTALLKGLTEGYIKGVAAAGLGLGALALIGHAVSKKGKNSEKKVADLTEDEKIDEKLKEEGFQEVEATI